MDWKTRFQDLCADCKRYFRQAFVEWGESIKDDPIQHFFSFAAGGVLIAGILSVL